MHGKKEYLSYPFLYERQKIVDFELLTDEITSLIGQAASFATQKEFQQELLYVAELVYHLNPCVRLKSSLEQEEVLWLQNRHLYYLDETKNRDTLFVLPSGTTCATTLHVVRTKAKQLVRLLHHITEEGTTVDDSIFDFSNILANYMFTAAMYANKLEDFKEIPFTSRLYKK